MSKVRSAAALLLVTIAAVLDIGSRAGPFGRTETSPSEDRVRVYVENYLKKQHIPGCAVMVRYNGKVAVSRGYGFANVEHSVAVTEKTLFQSASVGKQFTAIAIMILAEEHKVNLDDPVSKYLAVPISWSGIKLRHLLTHTSGLGDYPDWVTYKENFSEDELLKMVTDSPLSFDPGKSFQYSNLGYVTLGILIHRVTGKFYGDFLQERVFHPLHMSDTRVISDEDIIPNRAAGYVLDKNGFLRNQPWVSATFNSTADGTLYFNVGDLAKWDEALESEKLVSHDSFEQIWTPFMRQNDCDNGYGFGWYVCNDDSGHRIMWHYGRWQGFSSYIVRYPFQRLTVAVLCNCFDVKAGEIAEHIAALYLPAIARSVNGRYPHNPR